jgi:hypothetical protein
MGLTLIYGLPEKFPEATLLLPDDFSIRAEIRRETGADGVIIGSRTFSKHTLAKTIAEEFGLQNPIGEIERLLAVRESMSNVPEMAAGRDMIGYVSNIASLLTSLRSNGVFTSKDLHTVLGRDDGRTSGLANLLDSYDFLLRKRGQLDEPQRLIQIIELIDSGNSPKIFANMHDLGIAGFDELPRLTAEFYCSISKFTEVRFYSPLSGFDPFGEKRASAANAPAERLCSIAKDRRVDYRIEHFQRKPSPADDLIRALTGVSRDLEEIPMSNLTDWPILTSLAGKNPSEQAEIIASAVRFLICEQGVAPSEIAIFSEGIAEKDIRRALDEHDIKCFPRQDKPLAETAVADLLNRFFVLIRSGFGREEFRHLLSHRFIDHKSSIDFDNLARKCSIIGGFPVEDSWLEPLSACDSNYAKPLSDCISELNTILRGAKWGSEIPGEDFAKIIEDFFDYFSIGDAIAKYIKESDNDIIALKAESMAFEKTVELRGLFADLVIDKIKNYVDILFYVLKSDFISAHGGKGVKIYPKKGMSQVNARVKIFADFLQGEFPPHAPKNPIIDYFDAEKIGIVLPEFAYRKDFEFLSALESAELTLLVRPLAEGDSPKPPAPALVTLKKAMRDSFAVYETRMKGIAELLLARPYGDKRAQIHAGEWLHESISEENLPQTLIESDGTIRASKAILIEKNERPAMDNSFSGCLTKPFEKLLKSSFNALNVTQIDSYAKCPFAFFANNILEIKQPEEAEEDVSAKTGGTILHKVLEQFFRERMNIAYGEISDVHERIKHIRKEYNTIAQKVCVTAANLDTSQKRIVEILEKTVFELCESTPNSMARISLINKIKPNLLAYLEALSSCNDFVPIALEYSFSGNIGGCRIHGRADRIDCNRTGQLRIVDYKIGKSSTNSEITELYALQLPLYAILCDLPNIAEIAYVAEFKKELILKNVVSFAEDSPCKNVSKTQWEELLTSVRAEAEAIVARIHAGYFPPEPRGKCPDYCSYAGLCGRMDTILLPEDLK